MPPTKIKIFKPSNLSYKADVIYNTVDIMLGCFSLQLVRNVYSLSKFLLNKKKKVDLQQKKKTLKLLCCWESRYASAMKMA